MSLAYFERIDRVRFSRIGNAALWADKEDSRLRALYPAGAWSDLRAAIPGRSPSAIQQRAARLGIERRANAKPAWTGAEEKRLRSLFGEATWREVARALPRHSVSGIRNKANALGLRRPARTKLQSRYSIIRSLRALRREQRVSMGDLAEVIGVRKTTIQRWELGLSVPRLPSLLDWIQALGLRIDLVAEAA